MPRPASRRAAERLEQDIRLSAIRAIRAGVSRESWLADVRDELQTTAVAQWDRAARLAARFAELRAAAPDPRLAFLAAIAAGTVRP
jgi:hypothetical protein